MHPAVAECAVIPLLDERCGEVPIAVVVPRAEVDAEELWRGWRRASPRTSACARCASPTRSRGRRRGRSSAGCSGSRGSAVVRVEAAPGLAAERALGDQRARSARGTSAPIVLADRRRHVEPDEVEQRERAHRVPGAERACRCRSPRLQPGLAPCSATALEQVREQQPVDDEARRCPGPRRRSCRAPRTARGRARASSSLAAAGNASSTRSIFGTGLNTCRPTKRSGRPDASASSAIDSDEVVVARIASGRASAAELGAAARPWRRGPRRSPRRRSWRRPGVEPSVTITLTLPSTCPPSFSHRLRTFARRALGRAVGARPHDHRRALPRPRPPGRRRWRRVPAIPTRSDTSCSSRWLTGQSTGRTTTSRHATARRSNVEALHEMNAQRSRGRHRRGGPHADRARPPGEGLLQGHAPERAARHDATPR